MRTHLTYHRNGNVRLAQQRRIIKQKVEYRRKLIISICILNHWQHQEHRLEKEQTD